MGKGRTRSSEIKMGLSAGRAHTTSVKRDVFPFYFLNYYYWLSEAPLFRSHKTLPLAHLNKFYSNVFHSRFTSHSSIRVTLEPHQNQWSVLARTKKFNLYFLLQCSVATTPTSTTTTRLLMMLRSWKVSEFMHIIVRIKMPGHCSISGGPGHCHSCIAYKYF